MQSGWREQEVERERRSRGGVAPAVLPSCVAEARGHRGRERDLALALALGLVVVGRRLGPRAAAARRGVKGVGAGAEDVASALLGLTVARALDDGACAAHGDGLGRRRRRQRRRTQHRLCSAVERRVALPHAVVLGFGHEGVEPRRAGGELNQPSGRRRRRWDGRRGREGRLGWGGVVRWRGKQRDGSATQAQAGERRGVEERERAARAVRRWPARAGAAVAIGGGERVGKSEEGACAGALGGAHLG
mmetsp:Transcript_20189/g.34371  ORF Transcript_20189/g.34371 Transcript_20189/m.34371 type:complete len:247 (+) Transcript_20189:485-1225(+)